MTTATDITKQCESLKGDWSSRNKEFKDMYKLLTLDNSSIKREGMEYMISNEPATFFNMAIHILTPNPLTHRVLTYPLTPAQIVMTSEVEDIIKRGWLEVDKTRRQWGKESWFREVMTYLLLYGWYAVFVMADDNSLIADVWNPANTFPEFSDAGMSRVCRIVNMPKKAAQSLAISKQWSLSTQQVQSMGATVDLYDYWEMVNGKPTNSIVIDTILVKPPTPINWSTNIPVRVGTVNGLVDYGEITSASDSQKRMGRGILSTNKDLYTMYNKQLTFRQQMMRDTAQAKYWQKLRGKEKILTPEKMKQYGAIFTVNEGEEIGLLQSNILPAEMTSGIYATESALQRGAFPWTLYGNVSGAMSSFTMSQIAVAAQQVLAPYYEGYKNLVSDIDMDWLTIMMNSKVKPYSLSLPAGLPVDVSVECDYKLFIPGDINQRATTMRMVSPTTELSDMTALDMFFPEIGDPTKEVAKVRASKALNNPVAINIETISAYRDHADELKATGNKYASDLYLKAADTMEKEMMKQLQPSQNIQPNIPSNQNTGQVPGQPNAQQPINTQQQQVTGNAANIALGGNQ